MQKNIISRIIHKYLSARFPLDTEARVQKWMISNNDYEKEKEQASLEYWNSLNAFPETSTYESLQRVNRKIGIQSADTPTRTIPLYKKISRIAAILLPLLIAAGSATYYFYFYNPLIEITAAYGEKKHHILPDSSEVWLNSGTSIRYKKRFDSSSRLLTLSGEAGFSVKKDNKRPFIVQTPPLAVQVLGTKFNVKAYPEDNSIITTLLTGKVEVITQYDSIPHALTPNQQLTYDKHTAEIEVTSVNTEESSGWIGGHLFFTDATIVDIATVLQRRFNITIQLTGSLDTNSRPYTIRFLRNESLDEIINILKDMTGYNFRKQGNTIIISPAIK